jgi:hypothetical protein
MKVEKREDDGDLLVQDVLLAAFFCQKKFAEIAASFGDVFERWFARTPEEGRRWASVGPDSDTYKQVSARVLTAARDQLNPAKAKRRDMSALRIGGPEEINHAYGFAFGGDNDLEEDEGCYLEMRFPRTAVEPAEVEATVAFLRDVAAVLPFDSGYASFALTYGADSQAFDYSKAIKSVAFRHPGFDVGSSIGTASHIGKKLRGAYWLNFIGPSAAKKLGGAEKLTQALGKGFVVEALKRGVMVRASTLPEVGDTNKGKTLPELRKLAKVIEPVSLFDDQYIDNSFVDEDARARWERRHLD